LAISIFQQLVWFNRVGRRDRNANANVNNNLMAVDEIGLSDGFSYSPGQNRGISRLLQRRHDYAKFVPAQTRDRIRLSGAPT
jgi:hypothetical protein